MGNMISRNKSFVASIVVILGFALFFSSAGFANETKGTLVVATIFDAKTLDPHATNDAASSGAMLQIYETLVVLDDDNKIEPQLAERWERSNELI